MENWHPIYDLQVKSHSFLRRNAWFLDPVLKKSSKIFEFKTLCMSGRSKNHTLKGGKSLYSLCMGISCGEDPYSVLNNVITLIFRCCLEFVFSLKPSHGRFSAVSNSIQFHSYR